MPIIQSFRCDAAPYSAPLPPAIINPMGGNMAAGGAAQFSYENLRIFRNTVREGRGFTTTTNPWSAQVALSAAGWPTAAHTVFIWEGGNIPGWASAATSGTPFKCGYIGTGTPTAFDSCTIANYVAGNGTTTYSTFDLYNVTGDFGFQNSAAATNIFAYMPAYPASTVDDVTQLSAYTPEALAIWQNVAMVRWMDPSQPMQNTTLNTSTTRRTPSNTQSYQTWQGAGTEGYPQEWGMYLAKYAGIGYWGCEPVWEDGTNNSAGSYSLSWLTAINTIVVPTGKPVRIEISNELWNSQFPSGISGTTGTLQVLAVNNGFATSTSDYTGIYQYLAYRYHQLAAMCRSVFGSNFGPGQQVQITMPNQLGGYGFAFPTMLEYLVANYGSVSPDVQSLALAPYMNLTNNSGDTSTAMVLADLAAQAPVTAYNFGCEHVAIMARYYGISLCMYEGQWQVNSEAANAYISPALASSSITPILVTWLQACIDAGFTFPLNWWQIGCSQAASGNTPEDELSNNWSALVTTGSPQLSAIQTIAAGTYTPQRNIVAAVGTTTISLFADQLSAAPVSLTSDVNFLFSFGCAPAQVQFPVAATKQLSINVTGSGTVSVIIDNAIVATGVSVSTGTIVIGTYAFSAAQHSIAVGSNSYQNVSVNDLVFS